MSVEDSDLERALASDVQYVGPFEYHLVVVNGHRVPYLEATPLPGGGVHLSVDRRYGLDLSLAEAERVVPFVAHAIAIGMGFVGFPDEDQDEPVRAHGMGRVHRLEFDEPDEGDTPSGQAQSTE